MLLERDAPGDRDRAGVALHAAQTQYRQMGMPRHAGMVEDLISRR